MIARSSFCFYFAVSVILSSTVCFGDPPSCDLARERQFKATLDRFCGGATQNNRLGITGSRAVGSVGHVNGIPEYEQDSRDLATSEVVRDRRIGGIMSSSARGVPHDTGEVRGAMAEAAAIERRAVAICRRAIGQFRQECGQGQTSALRIAERQLGEREANAERFSNQSAAAQNSFLSATNDRFFDPDTPRTGFGRALQTGLTGLARYNPISLAATAAGYRWPQDVSDGVGGALRRDYGLAIFRGGANIPPAQSESNGSHEDTAPLRTKLRPDYQDSFKAVFGEDPTP